MIIDFHTHIYPDHVAEKTLKAVRERAAIRSYGDGTLTGLRQSMGRAGIDLSVVCSVATKVEQVVSIHQWLAGIRGPEIFPMATMHPDACPGPQDMRHLRAEGFRGFKVHPDFQAFFVDEKRMYPFYEAAQAEDMLILFHAGVDRGLPTPVHCTPKGLAYVHREFPRLKIVAAHMGGEGMYDETEKHLLGRNIYLDTSFVLKEMPRNMIRRFMDKHPAERFLFGSDTPWADQRGDLEYFLSLPFLNDDAREKMAGGNAVQLLGLDGREPAGFTPELHH